MAAERERIKLILEEDDKFGRRCNTPIVYLNSYLLPLLLLLLIMILVIEFSDIRGFLDMLR